MKRRVSRNSAAERLPNFIQSGHTPETDAEFQWEEEVQIVLPSSPYPTAECLTEEQSLGYLQQTLEANTLLAVTRHLHLCPVCAAEVFYLAELGHIWDTGETAVQLELQLALSSPMLMAALSARSVRMEPLLRPAGAFGEEDILPAVTLEFPVLALDGFPSSLQGVLLRQQRDYYAHISAPTDGDTLSSSCRILLTILDPLDTQPVLQRQIDCGVTVILGTDLRLTEACFVYAALLPVP